MIYANGTSALTLSNGTGTLTQIAGTLHVGSNAAISAGTAQINGGTLVAAGPATLITANLVYASSSTSNYQGRLNGAGKSLTVNNPAALLVLSGSNNIYSGGTFVTSGTLDLAGNGAFPDGSALTVAAGGTLIFGAPPSPAPVASPVAVPEPATWLLLIVGSLVYLMARRR